MKLAIKKNANRESYGVMSSQSMMLNMSSQEVIRKSSNLTRNYDKIMTFAF